MALNDDQTKQLEILFEEVGVSWDNVSHDLTEETCSNIKEISKENIADVLWCSIKNPTDKDTLLLLDNFIQKNKSFIQKNKKILEPKFKEVIGKLGLQPTTKSIDGTLANFDSLVKNYKKWNSSTKPNSPTYVGGVAPLIAVLCVLGLIGILGAWYWSETRGGGKPKRKTRKNRNRKPKKSQKKRKSRKNRKSNRKKR